MDRRNFLKAGVAAVALNTALFSMPSMAAVESAVAYPMSRTVAPGHKASTIAAALLISEKTKKPPLRILEEGGYIALADSLRQRGVSDSTGAIVTVWDRRDRGTTDFQDMVRPSSSFLKGGPRYRAFTHGKYRAPHIHPGFAPGDKLSGRVISMTAKKLMAVVPISAEVATWPLRLVEPVVHNELRRQLSISTDINAYFGSGDSTAIPLGILNHPGIGEFDAAKFFSNPTAPAVAELDDAAVYLKGHLRSNKMEPSPEWAWVMSHRTIQYLADLRVDDTTGAYAYPEIRDNKNPMWKDVRVLATSAVSENLGVTQDEATLALVDFSHVLYAEEWEQVRAASRGRIDDGTFTFDLEQQNMIAVRAEVIHDWTLEDVGAVAKMTGVRWGAPSITS